MSNHAPLSISVIIPVYNGAAFLAEALASVLAQQRQPLEIIVVDDGSTDNTASIVQQFGAAVRYIQRANGGPAAARNTGIRAATGLLLAFLDADDRWTPDKLSRQTDYLHAHPQVDYVLARMHAFLQPGLAWPTRLNQTHYQQDPVAVLLSAALIRRAVFDRVGNFDPTLHPADDVDWFARANDLGIQKGLIDAVLLHKRIHHTNISLTSTQNRLNLLKAVRRAAVRKRALQEETIC